MKHRFLPDSAAPLAMAFLLTGPAAALAQTVSLTGDTTPLAPGDIHAGTNIAIGDSGTGAMSIEGGAQVINSEAVIGSNGGSNGAVSVIGPGSQWTSTGSLYVGYSGTGTLNILGGARVFNADSMVGVDTDGVGHLLVSGPSSLLESPGRLTLGSGGYGSLRIEDGATVRYDLSVLGSSSRGDVVVTGPGTRWDTSGQLVVGSYDAATMLVEDGANVVSNQGYIGSGNTGNGAVLVTGSGSSWEATTYNISIGNLGAGALTIEDGGRVRASNGIDLGSSDPAATGTLTLRGTPAARGILETNRIGAGIGTANMTIDGGILRATENNSSFFQGFGSRSIVIGANGAIVDTNGHDMGVAAELAGTGGIVKIGPGELDLGGVNTYLGGTAINGGTLRVASDTSLGNAAGGLAFDGGTLRTTVDMASGRRVSLAGAGTFLADTGTTVVLTGDVDGAGSLGKDGAGTLVIAGNAMHSGGTNIVAGILQVGNGAGSGTLAGDVHNSGTLAFDRDDDIRFDGIISGTGRLFHRGDGTTILTAASDYSGPTDVLSGTLAIDGSTANSATTVHPGARLSGTGVAGATNVAPGGTIAPASGPGTLSVAGDYVQEAGSVYQVDVDPTSSASDLVAVAGTATLAEGALLDVTKTTDLPYLPGTRYKVLGTTAGLEGTFELTGETDLTAFIRLTDAYDANNAYLVTQQSRTIDSIGSTPNQAAAGAGIESLLPTHPVKTTVLNLSGEDTVREVLDELSGEIHASVRTATIENSHLVRDAITNRIREAFCGIATHRDDTGARTEDRRRHLADCEAAPDRLTAWGEAFGSWGHTGSDGNAARMERSTSGFLIGWDTPVFETWRFGIAAGHAHSTIRVDDRNSSATSKDYHVGAYGGTQWERLGLRAGVSYTWQNIQTGRSIGVAGFDDQLSADYDAGLTQAFGELGYRIDAGDTALEPFASLSYMNLDTGSFTEEGGPASLASPGNTTETFFTTLGTRASTVLAIGGTDVLARGSLGWRHAFGDTAPMSPHLFDGGALFDMATAPIARNAALVRASIDFRIGKDATLGISYDGQFSSRAADQGIQARLSLEF